MWLPCVLFLATCYTTYVAGGSVAFAATLMTILVTHEMGHYIAARRHGLDVSLPYFIPVPFAIGTMGAIIRMRAPIQRRDALADVGASGPLAGLAVALPLLVWGLIQSPVMAPTPGETSTIEGNSILYLLLKLIIKGQILPAPDGTDVQLGAVAQAAWVGMLVTFINLIPIGQLDGGHVAAAFFGERHERTARWLHAGLGVVGVVMCGLLALEAHAAGRPPWSALAYGAMGAMPWLVWSVLLLVMRRLSGGDGRYHPPVGVEPLSPSRRMLCFVTAVAFVLLFTPVPMREGL